MKWTDSEKDSFITNDGTEVFFEKRVSVLNIDFYVEASKFKNNINISLIQVLFDYGDANNPEYGLRITEVWKVPISEIGVKWSGIRKEILDIVVKK